MRKRRRRRAAQLGLLIVGALALTAGLLWRRVLSAPPAGHGNEEIDTAERQHLENILQQKNPGAQR